MWIISSIIAFIFVFVLLSNGQIEFAVVSIAFILIALFIRMSRIFSTITLDLTLLQQKYARLEAQLEETKYLQTSNEITPVNTVVEEDQAEHVEVDCTIEEPISIISTPQPTEPTIINRFIAYATKGNPLVKIGGALLFFGLSFLLKFAAQNDMISIEVGILSVITF